MSPSGFPPSPQRPARPQPMVRPPHVPQPYRFGGRVLTVLVIVCVLCWCQRRLKNFQIRRPKVAAWLVDYDAPITVEGRGVTRSVRSWRSFMR